MGLRCEIEPDDTSMVKKTIESLQRGCMYAMYVIPQIGLST